MKGSKNSAMHLTAPGTAAIAVIRLVGAGVQSFLEKHFSKKPAMGKCTYAELIDGDRVIDDAIVVLCDESTADLNVHGGAWVVRSVLELARREGFEISERQPGMALGDEMVDASTELEREVLRFLPLARTETGVRVLLAQERAWRELARQTGMSAPPKLEQILDDRTLVHLLFPPTVAIVGPANVGKSTLANQLFAQARSITADMPGTTRDWVGEFANINGLPVMLVDTPGLRETEDCIELAAIEGSRKQIARSQLVVLVLNATRPLVGEQESLLAQFPGAMLLLNKVDLPMGAGMGDVPAIRTVATAGQGIDELRARIVEFFCGERTITVNQPRVWTLRQQGVLQGVVDGRGSLDEL